MRKYLFVLTALAGAVAAAGGAKAMPSVGHVAPVPVLAGTPELQPVQYYSDWRYREWRRREAYEHWRRREAERRWHGGRGYGRSW